jgi:transcription elongation factor GreA
MGTTTMDYITAEDRTALEEKLATCVRKRKEITNRIAEARALGDLSENAEYHAAREDQGLNEATIRLLEERLAHAKVADISVVPEGVVFVGATVVLRDVDSEDEQQYKLVGQMSDDPDDDVIEVTSGSPMGEALMKARVGETVRVSLPRGDRRFEIVKVS